MDTCGRHLVVEFIGCEFGALNNVDRIRDLMERAARAAQMTIVTSVFHAFKPQGVTGVVVLEESHLSIHTWPEIGYAAVDFYTCGDGEPGKAREVLEEGLQAQSFQVLDIERGLSPRGLGSSMRLRYYSTGTCGAQGDDLTA